MLNAFNFYILKTNNNNVSSVFIAIFSSFVKYDSFIIPPANFVCRGYTVFTLSVRASVRVSVRPSVRPSVRNALFP